MNDLDFKANKVEENFVNFLFERFKDNFSNSNFVKLNSEKIIKFPLVFYWFRTFKFTKNEAKWVISKWVEAGLVERVPFHGIKIKEG
jgi:hypothetical protein